MRSSIRFLIALISGYKFNKNIGKFKRYRKSFSKRKPAIIAIIMLSASKPLSHWQLKTINKILAFYTLNMRPNCSTHSKTSCWWPKTFLLFIMRTIAASMAYRLSLSTSSITFFLSSAGGRGIYNQQVPDLLS